jgi:hypothetical protein
MATAEWSFLAASIWLGTSGNTPESVPLLATAASSSPVSTTCANMLKPFTQNVCKIMKI